MSGKNRDDKDSYAKDTLAFKVPPEAHRNNRSAQRPQGRYPQEQYPQGQYPQERYQQGQYPQERYQQGQYPQERYPQGQYPQERYPQGQYPQERYPQEQYPQGQYPQGQRAQPSQRQSAAHRSGQPLHQNRNGGHTRPNNQRSSAQRSGNVNGAQRRPPQQRQNNTNNSRLGTSSETSRKRQQKPLNNNAQQQKVVKVKKTKRRSGCLTRILMSLIGLFIVLFIIYSVIAMLLINKVKVVEEGERIAPSHSVMSSSDVRNILLIGTDSRGEDRGRSDSMILLSINSKTNKINMVSLMRDTYVQVPGYGGCKLNAAYSYGGPELLMDTIEENFYIDIDDYVTVNFMSFANIVDAVGGVEIEVNDSEADAINVLLDSKEGVSMFGQPDEDDYLNGGGTYKLNGKQALCYSRLRKVGNADFERTERQRKVLSGILKNAATLNPFKIGSVAGDALPSMTTNLSKGSMYLLSLRLPIFLLGYDIEQLRIPAEDTYWGSDIDGESVLEIDFDANIDMIKKDLYDE